MKTIPLFSISILALSACSRLGSIPYSPPQTPESWLTIQPFLRFSLGSRVITLVQPSSTIFVYLLGIVAIAGGLYTLWLSSAYRSRRWWGIALLLWGLGALAAGTSYQAFSYEIKCAGRALCSWTSGWEVAYLILSGASVDAMLMAEAHAGQVGKRRNLLMRYGWANLGIYTSLVLAGAWVPVKFLVSFELLLLVATPNILLLFALNGWRAYRQHTSIDLKLVVAWLWLGLTIGVYFVYLMLDISHQLWQLGIWFSENDVLHIGLILWMLYLIRSVAPKIMDAPK